MSPIRLIRAPKMRGTKAGTDVICTTQWLEGKPGTPHAPRHEHVTLETPKPHSETQKLRIMTAREMGKSFP
jgi:hypothetical protein